MNELEHIHQAGLYGLTKCTIYKITILRKLTAILKYKYTIFFYKNVL